uniref:Methyltransferase FkbM domain-containing protein n=1 Tax=Eutreptiella gymnastica TaxID=73025 RepID=A0A7S1NNQ9_9EUGL|mmetsp:Transcript_6775/g.12137  ORF Transcript_6775/g.12137 Transcript_6775/m.12137 type:complete len:318 (+) Transcript_6775:82-1035(+)
MPHRPCPCPSLMGMVRLAGALGYALMCVWIPLVAPHLSTQNASGLKSLRYTPVVPEFIVLDPPGSRKKKVTLQDGRLVTFIAPVESKDLIWIIKEVIHSDEYGLSNRQLPPNATIVDIGGNIGVASVVLGLTFPTATILTFEPMPLNFQYLLRNLAVNNITNVRPHNVGLSKYGQMEQVTFFLKQGGSSGSTRRDSLTGDWVKKNQGKVINIHTATVDQVYDVYHLNRVDLMKIDCEGCEYSVIPHLANRTVSRFVGEVHGQLSGLPLEVFDLTIRTLCMQEGQEFGLHVTNCCGRRFEHHTKRMRQLRLEGGKCKS